MSPEQAAGRSDLDARTDVYALGGVGFYLLTGRPPFPRETAMEMMLAHAYEAPQRPGDLRGGVPTDLEAVILKCLAKKREDRFADVTQVERALEGCRSAGLWTEERARAWWQVAGRKADDTQEHAVLTTAAQPA
jgi:serine/threonine-protein kinase